MDTIRRLEHLVIPSAGVTCAVFPEGDDNGIPIPAMNGLMEKNSLAHK